MSNRCLHCNEAWDFEDYACPVCDRATVEQDSSMEPTLEYVFENEKGERINPYNTNPVFDRDGQRVNFVYDVIRIATGKSVFGEAA
jgi:hypothetical protein